jgi:hypothetical protein
VRATVERPMVCGAGDVGLATAFLVGATYYSSDHNDLPS